MPRSMRATIIQPDPDVPADRFGRWLSGNRVLVRAIPLWQLGVPDADSLGDGLIVLGGRMSAHDGAQHAWMEPLKRLLREAVEAEIPTLAICLGHQLLAEAFGGEVAVNHPGGGEHGAVEVDWHLAAADDPLLDRLAANGRSVVAASHHDAVTRLPEGSVSLAASRDYPNQAFRVGSALGVQFHPEASPELMGRWAALDGGDARTMRRSMQTHDSEVARTGRLLAQAFTGHLRAQQLAA
ncbi:MAG TPA: type 1 glutamine amidotransferase [Propionicimonas sp.]|nr:type 1 glutamine amidotransferase [Propionicimonas sp.]HQA78281.1 type 1 glutamine amidotransferase [Propionicimonas sp.]HQD96398.1 type 1 glutamine amidotransferase [Propionicimonas sp.]